MGKGGGSDGRDDDDEEREAAALWVPQYHHGYLNTPRTSSSSSSSYYVDNNEPCFKELPTPRQTNLYDCGLYVMAIARVICRCFCTAACSATATSATIVDDGHDANIMKHVDISLESTTCSELLVIIEQLKSHSTSTSFDDQMQPQPHKTRSILLCDARQALDVMRN